MKELNITNINNKLGYGGNQEWFTDEWAIKAGCASVLGSNLYAYYKGIKECSKDEYLVIMEDLYAWMTPGKMGYPYFYKFAHKMVERLQKEDIYLKPRYLKKSKSIKQSVSFVKECINSNHPIGVLILTHKAKELEEDTWHWICISGYNEKEDDVDIIFSSYGVRRVIQASILFDVDIRNIVKLVSFENL